MVMIQKIRSGKLSRNVSGSMSLKKDGRGTRQRGSSPFRWPGGACVRTSAGRLGAVEFECYYTVNHSHKQ